MTKNTLHISGLELLVCLGWTDKERLDEQVVRLDIDILFPKTPEACTTDKLEDTVCYSTLIKKIRHYVQLKKFRLIENLAYEIYGLIKASLPDQAETVVHITKHPDIPGLVSVRFSYAGSV